MPVKSPSEVFELARKNPGRMNSGSAGLEAGDVGAGGYGERIATGLAINDNVTLMAGALPAAVLAIIVQGAFELAERRYGWMGKARRRS